MESRGLRSEMQVYDDWSHLSYEETKEIIDKLNSIGCMSFVISESNKGLEERLLNGTDKETKRRIENRGGETPQ